MPNLSQALRIFKLSRVAFVGAGGKTSAMFRVARELAPALVTTSTHLGAWQTSLADHHFIWRPNTQMPGLEAQLPDGVTLVTGQLDTETQRYAGLAPFQLEELSLLAKGHNMPFLVEADGSRQKPLKAPADNEPAIPEFIDLVILVAGLSGLQKPLNAENVHHPTIFGDLAGLAEGETVGATALAKVLTHPNGGLKNIPEKARRVVLLNQADTEELQSRANEIGRLALSVFDAVVVTSLDKSPEAVIAVIENIAAVILAAGASSRFGKPKQLLDYHGKPFLRVVAETAIKAGLSPVIVVSGANSEDVSSAIDDLPLTITYNPRWKDGQSSSIQAGLAKLPLNTGGAVFLLADQPQVSVEVLLALVEHHSQDLPAILAPYVFDQRANPLLFDRVTFEELFAITGDTGGRAIFSKFSPRYLNWYDRRLLLDVDTPEDYQKLLSSEPTV